MQQLADAFGDAAGAAKEAWLGLTTDNSESEAEKKLGLARMLEDGIGEYVYTSLATRHNQIGRVHSRRKLKRIQMMLRRNQSKWAGNLFSDSATTARSKSIRRVAAMFSTRTVSG